MKADFKAEVLIDDKTFAEFTANVEVPSEDEAALEEFNKNFESILKIKFLEDEQIKAFVLQLIDQKTRQTNMSAYDATNDFFDNRMKVVVQM